ncbi:hypothetical protein C1645_841294 [Glomus cerebriforme]|uniref:F-box domain-containing protein n=1 Tax=Glomus cerebriforme TaxID=658196 RepID=A0A397RZS5_9GLOM|nr:hypothetical protein C1645_841294 [Glomus cerebriforme]
MSSQLPIDCLIKILECLEKDKTTLHSCLLVNHILCRISVEILWRNIWSFYLATDKRISSRILDTLIACLPNESKILINEIGILTEKSSLFNYASFCKVLSIDHIIKMICCNIEDPNHIILSQIMKMFMKQISSLKMLIHFSYHQINILNFIDFSEAKNCLKNLSKLKCNSYTHAEFYHQISQICHNIQKLDLVYCITISNNMKELISLQNDLKYLSLYYSILGYGNYYNNCNDFVINIVPSLIIHSNTLTTLRLEGELPLSFITKLINLQYLHFTIGNRNYESFKEMQYFTFPHLQILKLDKGFPIVEMLIMLVEFLKNNGMNLKKLYMKNIYEDSYKYNDSILNLAIALFCPNLKSLCTQFTKNVMKYIFQYCQRLEKIKLLSGIEYPFEGEQVLEIVGKYSSKNFHELKLYSSGELGSVELESFFIDWKDASRKPISLIVSNYTFAKTKRNRKIIRKYKNLGVIKKFLKI